jgi:hypothetical protein
MMREAKSARRRRVPPRKRIAIARWVITSEELLGKVKSRRRCLDDAGFSADRFADQV